MNRGLIAGYCAVSNIRSSWPVSLLLATKLIHQSTASLCVPQQLYIVFDRLIYDYVTYYKVTTITRKIGQPLRMSHVALPIYK